MLVEILVRFEPEMLVDFLFCFPLIPQVYMHTCTHTYFQNKPHGIQIEYLDGKQLKYQSQYIHLI